MNYRIEIHNVDKTLVAYLKDIIEPDMEEAVNTAGMLYFDLDADDDNIAYITPANRVWLRRLADDEIWTYKLSKKYDSHADGKATVRYECIGLLSQLRDEIIEDYDTGATGDTVTNIVTAWLALQTGDNPITVGTIESTDTVAVASQGDDITSALLKMQEVVGGYISVNEDNELDWLSDIGDDIGQQIRYRKNLKGIEKESDYASFGNRLYCYGAGEGTARIKLSDADGHTEDYVEDAASQTTYGIVTKQLVDKTITHPNTLLVWANQKLAEMKTPKLTYRVDMVELSETSNNFSFDKLLLGSVVKVIDEELGIDVEARIVRIRRPDLYEPHKIEVEIANRVKDVTNLLGQIYNVQQLREHIATRIGAGQVSVLGDFNVSDWVTGGTTNIKGGYIRTGVIESTNWDATHGAQFDLDNGTFKLGGSSSPSLSWNGTTLTVNGYIQVGGAASDVNSGVTTISGGKITTNSLDVNVIKSSTLGVSITLGAGGKFVTADSPNPRIEIENGYISGYSDATTKQFYLQASDGKAYAAGGKVVLDAAGLSLIGDIGDSSIMTFKEDASTVRGYIFFRTVHDAFYIGSVGKPLYLSGSATAELIRFYGNLEPSDDDDWKLGTSSKKMSETHSNKVYAYNRLIIPEGTNMYD